MVYYQFHHNVIVPRVLFKNGKQNKRFLENARRPVQRNTQLPATQIVSPAVEAYHNLEPVANIPMSHPSYSDIPYSE